MYQKSTAVGPGRWSPEEGTSWTFFLNVIRQDAVLRCHGDQRHRSLEVMSLLWSHFWGWKNGLARLSFQWRRKSPIPSALTRLMVSWPSLPSSLPMIPSMLLSSLKRMFLPPLMIGHLLMLFNFHTS